MLGSMTVPIIYAIMKESGYSTIIAAFSACLVLFGMPQIFCEVDPALMYSRKQITLMLLNPDLFFWTRR